MSLFAVLKLFWWYLLSCDLLHWCIRPGPQISAESDLWICNKRVAFLMKTVAHLGHWQAAQHWLLKIEDEHFLKISHGWACSTLSDSWGQRDCKLVPCAWFECWGAKMACRKKTQKWDEGTLRLWSVVRENMPFFIIFLTLLSLKRVSVSPERVWVFSTSLWKVWCGVYVIKYTQSVV